MQVTVAVHDGLTGDVYIQDQIRSGVTFVCRSPILPM
jgi:hypothetical protein